IVCLLISELRKRKAKEKYGTLTESMGSMIGRWAVFSILILAAVFILNDFKGIPIPVMVMAIVVVIFTFISQKTTFGRSIYAIGGNTAAVKYAGINVKKNLTLVYMLNGLLCAVAAVVYTARHPGAGQPRPVSGPEQPSTIGSEPLVQYLHEHRWTVSSVNRRAVPAPAVHAQPRRRYGSGADLHRRHRR